VFDAWHSNNDWYFKDPDMTGWADATAHGIKQAEPNLTPAQVFEKVSQRVKDVFPHKFSNLNREGADTVDGSTTRTNTTVPTGKKTYNDLPADAKALCDSYVEQKLLTKEQYLKDYFEQEG
jgi:hypothetical protein